MAARLWRFESSSAHHQKEVYNDLFLIVLHYFYMLGRIFLGVIISFVGWLMVWKTRWFEDMLGQVSWAEQHLGNTNFFYKLLGTAVIILGFIVTLNLFDVLIGSFIRSLFA